MIILLLDDELIRYYDMPCHYPYYSKGSFTDISDSAAYAEDEPELV